MTLQNLRKLCFVSLLAISLPTLLTLPLAHAEPPSDDLSRPTIGKSGQIFSIELTPKAKKLTVGLVGKPITTIDPNQIVILGKSYPINGKPLQLRIIPVDSHYEILDSLDQTSTIEFEIKDKKSNKKESIRVETGPKR